MEFVILEETLVGDSSEPCAHYFYGHADHIRCFEGASLSAAFNTIEKLRAEGKYLVGAISYEAAYAMPAFKRLVDAPIIADKPFPLLHFIAFEHHELISTEQVSQLLKSQVTNTESFIYNNSLSFDKTEYADQITAVKNYIEGGYTYQVNFTGKYHFDYQGDAVALYLLLRERQKVKYSALFNLKDYQILSLSPELYFRKMGDLLETSPMKGTMPRSNDLDQDIENRDFLKKDPKSLAENLMIVDLLRNDLNRIAYSGTVNVSELFRVESYQTVHQMVSTVIGKINKHMSLQDILHGIFPCGSITGAPKYKTMQIINELETKARKIYTGAIGYITPENDMCFNVPIRTLLLEKGKGELGVGSGIVADSDIDDEFSEVKLKAKFLQHVGIDFNLIECFRFDALSGYANLKAHLSRLQQSAKTFGFSLDLAAIRDELNRLQNTLAVQAIYKIRIELAIDGKYSLSYTQIKLPAKPYLLAICDDHRVDSGNILLQHKTTAASVRQFYQSTWQAYAAQGVDEVLFKNENGYITEGTKTNVFIVKEGQWYTPPVRCGLLPGVMRDKIIQQKHVQEKSISETELLDADEIWLTNSVVGLQSARVMACEPCTSH